MILVHGLRRATSALALFALAGTPPAFGAGPAAPASGGVPAFTAELAAQCGSLSAGFAREGTKLRLLRAIVGKDGKTQIEESEIEGEIGNFYQGKVRLTQFGLGDPTKVVIVYGHPGIEIPPHASPYKELFFILSGMSEMILADGTRLVLTPGTLFLSEDQGGPPRGGSAGPCGYVALDLQFKDAK